MDSPVGALTVDQHKSHSYDARHRGKIGRSDRVWIVKGTQHTVQDEAEADGHHRLTQKIDFT